MIEFKESCLEQNVVVNCRTQEEADSYCKWIADRGKVQTFPSTWVQYKENWCMSYSFSGSSGYCSRSFYKEKGCLVYSYEEALLKDPPTESPLDSQVGGGHYKKYKIQPVEYIHANGIGYLEGNIIKYTTRYKDKNGLEDLKKVIHYAQLLMELKYDYKESN